MRKISSICRLLNLPRVVIVNGILYFQRRQFRKRMYCKRKEFAPLKQSFLLIKTNVKGSSVLSSKQVTKIISLVQNGGKLRSECSPHRLLLINFQSCRVMMSFMIQFRWPFKRFKKEIAKCISWDEALKRVREKLQICGKDQFLLSAEESD